MKILVKAKPNAREEKVERMDTPTLFGDREEQRYTVSVKEPPVDDKANRAICRALADHFKTSVYNVRIVSGHTSKNKVVEVG